MPSRRLSPNKSVHMAQYCASANLRRAARVITRHYDAALRRTGVSATQLPLLAAINAGWNTSISTLAQSLDLERSTISRELAILKKRKLVADDAATDRRARPLKLTARGHATLSAAFRAWQRAHDAIIAAYGDDSYEALLIGVRDLGRAAKKLAK